MPDAYETGDFIRQKIISEVETIPPEEREPLPEANRGSWYCPCAEPRHEKIVRSLMDKFDLDRVCDLGAGDLRLASALSDDYDVVAYETNERLAEMAFEEHGEPDIDLRISDYYAHWDAMKHRNALFVCIGQTNVLPGRPSNGIGIQGDTELTIVFGDSDA